MDQSNPVNPPEIKFPTMLSLGEEHLFKMDQSMKNWEVSSLDLVFCVTYSLLPITKFDMVQNCFFIMSQHKFDSFLEWYLVWSLLPLLHSVASHVSSLQIGDQICLLMQSLVCSWGCHLCQHINSHVIWFWIYIFFNPLHSVTPLDFTLTYSYQKHRLCCSGQCTFPLRCRTASRPSSRQRDTVRWPLPSPGSISTCWLTDWPSLTSPPTAAETLFTHSVGSLLWPGTPHTNSMKDLYTLGSHATNQVSEYAFLRFMN